MNKEATYVRLFGQLQVRQGDIVIDSLRTSRAGALLGYLCLFHGERSREEISTALWGTKGGDLANKLSVTLYQLRKELIEAGINADEVIAQTRETLALRRDLVTSDHDEFTRLIAISVGKEEGAGLTHKLKAIELYRNDLLPSFNEGWVWPRRAQALGDFLDAVLATMHSVLQSGDLATAWALVDDAIGRTGKHDDAAALVLRYLLAGKQYDRAAYVARELRLGYNNASPALRQVIRLAEGVTSEDPLGWPTQTLMISDRQTLGPIPTLLNQKDVVQEDGYSYVPVSNPLLGLQLAKLLLQKHPRTKLLLHTQAFGAKTILSPQIRNDLRETERGTVRLTTSARAVYEASRPARSSAVVETLQEADEVKGS